MKLWLAAVLTMLLLCTAAAQTSVPPATVEGIVKNQKTGDPIPDVRVTLTPEVAPGVAKNATTDVDGKFSITARTLFR